MPTVASITSRFNQLTPVQMNLVARSIKALEGNRYERSELRFRRAIQAYVMMSGEVPPPPAVTLLRDLVAFDFKVS